MKVAIIELILVYTFSIKLRNCQNILDGKHLVVVTAETAPYVYIDRDSYGKLNGVHGMVNELVVWLAAKYNFTYHYVEPTDGFYGSFVNNSWNGMVRMAINSEVDLIAFPFTPTFARTRVIDFAIPFAEDPMAALIPLPTEAGKLMAVIKPYTIEVWILIIVSTLSLAVVTWITMNFTIKIMPNVEFHAVDLSLAKHIIVTFGVLCCQGQHVPQNVSHSTRIAASAWSLTCIVLVYLYSGCLISFITIPKMHPVAETIEELVDNQGLEIFTFKSHFFESYVMAAKDGTYKKLGDVFRKQPDKTLGTEFSPMSRIAEKIKGNNLAFLMEETFIESIIDYQLKKSGKCQMSMMKHKFYPTREAFAVPKGRPYLKLIDQGMNIMREIGYTDYWYNMDFKKLNKCTAPPSSKKKRAVPKIKMADLIGVFVLLGCGILASVVVYVTERIVFALSKKRPSCPYPVESTRKNPPRP